MAAKTVFDDFGNVLELEEHVGEYFVEDQEVDYEARIHEEPVAPAKKAKSRKVQKEV